MPYSLSLLPVCAVSGSSAFPRPHDHAALVSSRLKGGELLATLAQVPNINVPQYMGYQVPLEGGSGGPQTFTVTSSNPKIAASVAQGQFWNINVSHTSSGASDPSFNGC